MKNKSAIFSVLLVVLFLSILFNCKKEAIKTAPTATISAVTNITATSASSGGEITADGGAAITVRGVCWSTNQSPTTSDSKTSNGSGTGSFTSSIIGLTPGGTYNIRAYATNSEGTGYSSQSTFTTLALAPVLTTTDLSVITSTTANSGGNITNDGGSAVTARGVCWSTSQNPTIADSKISSGTGTGSFTSVITGLTPGATYYIRAYATNSIGTGYGNQITATALANLPTITTAIVSVITAKTATSGGSITSDGGAAITACGVCWSTTPTPTITNSKTIDGSGIFTSSLTGLMGNTTYYLRAYATNSAGTGYGSQVSFKTLVLTVTDIDGNVYHTVTIGTQVWMAENLKTTKYRNGNSIPQLDNWDWAVNSGPGYGYPAGNPNNNSLYGKLYNWYAANNSNNIAPQGWHIPSIEEYQTLIDFLGGNMVAGSKMKTSNYWWTFDGIGTVAPTNSSGFSMLPAGSLRDAGMSGIDDLGIGGIGYLWSSGENGNGYLIRVLYCNNISGSGLPEILSTQDSKSFGFSVRCVKD